MLVHSQDMTYYHQNRGPFAMSFIDAHVQLVQVPEDGPLMPICSCLYRTLSSLAFVSTYNPTVFAVILPIISRKNSTLADFVMGRPNKTMYYYGSTGR